MQPNRSTDAPITSRGDRFVIYREPGTYAAFPRLVQLPDGRLAVGISLNTGHDHYMLGQWRVLVSADGGATWAQNDDPTIPLNWSGSSPRERWDRATHILPDGTWLAVGAMGWEAVPAEREAEVIAAGRYIHSKPGHHLRVKHGRIAVGTNTLVVQRSHDRGQTWERRETALPPADWTNGFPRETVLSDGSLLLPLRQRMQTVEGRKRGQALALHVSEGGERLRLYPIPRDLPGASGDEAALIEVSPDRVLMLMRFAGVGGGDGRLLCSWSEDGGCTWTFPVVTPIWGFPPHLLKLADGRVLCTYGHRRAPLGIQAVISVDGGETWDVAHRAILVDDGETVDLGYPMSVQLADGSIYTAYYVTLDAVTHSVGLRWELPW